MVSGTTPPKPILYPGMAQWLEQRLHERSKKSVLRVAVCPLLSHPHKLGLVAAEVLTTCGLPQASPVQPFFWDSM